MKQSKRDEKECLIPPKMQDKGEQITKPDTKLQIHSSWLIKELITKKEQLRARADLPRWSRLRRLPQGARDFCSYHAWQDTGLQNSSEEPPENCENEQIHITKRKIKIKDFVQPSELEVDLHSQ